MKYGVSLFCHLVVSFFGPFIVLSFAAQYISRPQIYIKLNALVFCRNKLVINVKKCVLIDEPEVPQISHNSFSPFAQIGQSFGIFFKKLSSHVHCQWLVPIKSTYVCVVFQLFWSELCRRHWNSLGIFQNFRLIWIYWK